jgi:hypothetical protein
MGPADNPSRRMGPADNLMFRMGPGVGQTPALTLASNPKPGARGLLGFLELDWTALGIVMPTTKGSKLHQRGAARATEPHIQR